MARPKKGQQTETNSPIKKLREAAELSQEELARLMDVSVSTISRWERGLTEPTMTVAQMKAFCNAIGKTLDQIPNSLLAPEE
ncbi:MAG: helix-turn-helix transcriptional regulator [Plectolyngbya sp. WJT66-NPBG17]|jgi:transcriptional regulator with XRE-family HTH domain|nr:helix-turn-helix transcriptional regulator [Plectolyngbya sp. WJT66-NPBG17]MBW4527389.1 helix-turn-helix transcriptional regulator [Phormidium tanganyikae FI6-MK23]